MRKLLKAETMTAEELAWERSKKRYEDKKLEIQEVEAETQDWSYFRFAPDFSAVGENGLWEQRKAKLATLRKQLVNMQKVEENSPTWERDLCWWRIS